MAGSLLLLGLASFGFLLNVQPVESEYCYSRVRGTYSYCSRSEHCCSSNSDPCCDDTELTTGAIIGIVIAVIFVIVCIALFCYLLQRAQNRKRTGFVTTTTTTIPVQTIHTTTYNQGGYGMQGYQPPGQPYPVGQQYPPQPQYNANPGGSDPVYPPPPPAKY